MLQDVSISNWKTTQFLTCYSHCATNQKENMPLNQVNHVIGAWYVLFFKAYTTSKDEISCKSLLNIHVVVLNWVPLPDLNFISVTSFLAR